MTAHAPPSTNGAWMRQLARSPAFIAFAVVWIACAALVVTLTTVDLFIVGYLFGLALLAAITMAITLPAPPPPAAHGADRRRIYAQIGVLLAIIILTGLNGLAFHGVIEAPTLPVWTDVSRLLETWSFDLFGNSNFLINPVQYFVVPLIALLLLGARPVELGFTWGHRTWRVVALWCALPVLLVVYVVARGEMTVAGVGASIVSNGLQNGFFEEFLFRGALQTRLSRLTTPGWALVISSVLFGVWHVGLGYTNHGDSGWLVVIASTIFLQGFFGAIFGILFMRTRSLIAPSIVHVALNVIGRFLG